MYFLYHAECFYLFLLQSKSPPGMCLCVWVSPATFGKFLSRRLFVTIRPVLLIKAFFSAF